MNIQDKKITIIIGAGSTLSDAMRKSKKMQPPVDSKFFEVALKTNKSETTNVIDYINKTYGHEVIGTKHDSLEGIMAKIFVDTFDPNLRLEASKAFKNLILLFNKRLASTTNDLNPTRNKNLYRILIKYLKLGIKPENLTIITFNQDIQIEKILFRISETWSSKSDILFSFPYNYELGITEDVVTKPTKTDSNSDRIFPLGDPESKGVKILKLHGSLNWYSVHNSKNLDPRYLFNQSRNIRITRRKKIISQMSYTGSKRKQYAFPLIVPPINHKSTAIHNLLKPLWQIAENDLKSSNEVVIFGYSCPLTDMESVNMIQRALMNSTEIKNVSVINPDPKIMLRYLEIINPQKATYYPFAEDFIKN